MHHERTGARGVSVILACVLILLAGVGSMAFLIATKQSPALADEQERSIRVETQIAQPGTVPVTISGLGNVRALDEVTLSVEVPGRVVDIHPRLEVGEVVKKDELLLKINPVDYQNGLDKAKASVAQMESGLVALRQQFASDQDRATTLRRSRDLAQDQFKRIGELFEKDQVGTKSGVEQAEMNLNMAQDGVTQIEQALSIYPARIQEMESGLAAAKAGLSMAESSLARTEIRAPFDGRLKMVQVEKDQFVSPGMPVLMLANDSVLKISVNLDSRDARRWLRFTGVNPESEAAWFRGVEQVTCKILWPEDPENHYWEGTLDRVEAFDPRSRTVTVSVEIAGRDALSKDPDQLPLVDGMYCQVEIPGKELENVYRLPRWAVSFDGTVYIAKDNRLEIRQVKVLRTEGEETIVSEGLSPGDAVIVTRLVNPLPGSLLEIIEKPAPAEGGA